MATGAGKKVVILGGGVAGMSAAHELVVRGFQVEVFERRAIPGGKARSLEAVGPSYGRPPFGPGPRRTAPVAPRRPPLPGEHGFRFFPGFYKHIIDTMARIPYQGGTVAQNLVAAKELRLAPFDRPSFMLPVEFPRTPDDLKLDLFAIMAALSGQLGVSLDDGLFFADRMWQFLTSCEERRLVEYERINWWDFIEAPSRSAAYQKYFGDGITRSLVAAKARRASTKTIGDIFMQIVFDILMPDVAADRLLNGPTNDVWINPWLKFLQDRGVAYHFNADVRSIECHGGRIRSATIAIGKRLERVSADYFIAALPVERMAELLNPGLLGADPSLANLYALTEYLEWMTGIQYYLTEDVPLARGHTIFVDTPWALTAVSQRQFWTDVDLASYADGTVKGLLSVDISDWDVKGLNGKEARHCSREEIAVETWTQLKRSLNTGGEVLRDDQVHSWFLDPGLDDLDADADPLTPRLVTNAEPLLVNYVDTWRIRPEAVTRIPNFFLASDYVRTFTDLATMEAANEAARRAVNGVLRDAGSDAEPCAIWNLHEPELFLPFRAYDRIRYRKGLGWNGDAMAFARSVLGLATGAEPFAGEPGNAGALHTLQESIRQVMGVAPEVVAIKGGDQAAASPAPAAKDGQGAEVAAEARASSDEGLRRMRIVQGAP
jgi:uncharacterized protein with NAD-binding domain and iron-sulfur cluster